MAERRQHDDDVRGEYKQRDAISPSADRVARFG
jgi:hypothetical protein